MSVSANEQRTNILSPILGSCIYSKAILSVHDASTDGAVVRVVFVPQRLHEVEICTGKAIENRNCPESSTLAQRKRDGPITHRSLDRNQQVLTEVVCCGDSTFAVNIQQLM